MRRNLLLAFQADRQYLRFRWLMLGFAAFVAFGVVNPLFIGANLAIASLLGVGTLFAVKNLEIYKAKGHRYPGLLRLADLIALCGASIFDPVNLRNLWLIAIPIILIECLSTTKGHRSFLFTAVAIAIVSYNGMMKGNLESIAVPAGSLIFTQFLGYLFAKFQAKDGILRERDRRLTTLMNTAANMSMAGDLRSLILSTLRAAVNDLGASAGTVTLTCEEDNSILLTEAAYGVKGDFDFPVVITMGEGISGYVAKTGQPITLTAKDGELIDCDGIGLPVKSAYCLPLVNREFAGVGVSHSELMIGAMTIINSEENVTLEPEELDLLQSLSSLLANAVHNARMEERSRATFIRTLESLATALEARDEYTRGHSQRVCDLSVMIGTKLGLLPDALEELRIGTILHDIGKIGVPDHILNKPGRLTDEEFAIMRTHPVIGYEICRPLMLSEGVLLIIRNHHEKLDGSGYPDGLKGGELPLSLRIVCVADAFDAMSSRRPYRGVMDMGHVMGEMSKGAGIQFDPVVVEALKELLTAGELDPLYVDYWTVKPPLEVQEDQAA
ncbi:MAG: HD domain-containing protein [Armatimonadetes bacterium]|nr:HD domain-containing protein [Armatimonadota bacterium]